MPKLPRIPAELVIRALKRARFYEHHQTGSHVQMKHLVQKDLRITIPLKKKDLSPKTLKSIIKQARFKVEEFIDLL